jgi:hypothetical protein
VLLASLDASITLIALPDIFRGIPLDPLRPSSSRRAHTSGQARITRAWNMRRDELVGAGAAGSVCSAGEEPIDA